MRGIRRRLRSTAGFTLLELLITLAILAILAGAVTPRLVEEVRLRAAQTTARDLAALADAARAFYVAQFPAVRWPAGFAELQATGYLPAGFSAANPFGQPYTMAQVGPRLQLGTTVPATLGKAVARLLPLSAEQAGAVTTEYPVPGQASDFTLVTLRLDDHESRLQQLRTDLDALTTRVQEADWAGKIVLSNGTCPAGWTRFTAADGLGLTAFSTAGITGGQTTYLHNHGVSLSGRARGTVEGSTGSASLSTMVEADEPNVVPAAVASHTHSFAVPVDLPVSVGGATDFTTMDIVPPFYTVVLCQRNAQP